MENLMEVSKDLVKEGVFEGQAEVGDMIEEKLGKPDLTDYQKKEIEHLWNTSRRFRKHMLSRRFSATAIKPKL